MAAFARHKVVESEAEGIRRVASNVDLIQEGGLNPAQRRTPAEPLIEVLQ